MNIPPKKQLPLVQFVTKIADALILASKPKQAVGRPKRLSSEIEGPSTKKGRHSAIPFPPVDSRYDGMCHWPEMKEKRTDASCASRATAVSTVKSAKCACV